MLVARLELWTLPALGTQTLTLPRTLLLTDVSPPSTLLWIQAAVASKAAGRPHVQPSQSGLCP